MRARHAGIDAYIDGLSGWQRDTCRELRELIHLADPEIEETVKRTVRPYFLHDGTVCALLATKDHVNLFLYDPAVPDPHGLINQGQGNATAQSIQIYENDPVDRDAIVEIIAAIVARNKAGGWRRLGAGDGSRR